MLTFGKIELKSGNLGTKSNIPDIVNPNGTQWFECDDTVGEKEKGRIGHGMVPSILPYKMQNMYDRDMKMRKYDCAVLENEYLKAVFIPELGGRLWSLYDKKLRKDIIYKNDALIFANLAICNAWFAGGVEWNVGVRGHTHFTCSPIFARKVIGKKGHEILRMYEYEEIRKLVYCIEATLDGDRLAVHITVKNTSAEPTYMYWWSNIAVEQKPGTRYFVPASRSFVTSYREGGFRISKIDVPYVKGKEISDPYHPNDAIDYFFDIPDDSKKWISNIEEDGKGLLQCSDSGLFGRKAFLWGNIPGGVHWNSWLTDGRDYYEIQAGLCKTQFEHFLIDGGQELSWNEIYKGIDIGNNRGEFAEISKIINGYVPEKIDFSDIFDEVSVEPIAVCGRGKGYLTEKIRGIKMHKKCEFPIESVSAEEQYYLDLIEGREAKGEENTAFVCGREWLDILLGKKLLSGYDKYVIGIIYYTEKDYEKSMEYLKASVDLERKYYSLAALALLCANVYGKYDEATKLISAAVELHPTYIPLVVKYGEIAIKNRSFDEFISFYENACTDIKNFGRIKMYLGQCLVEKGELELAKKYINENLVVEDVREGEYAVSNIWVMLYKLEMARKLCCDISEITDAKVLEEYPLPYDIDFRMH